MSLAMLLAAALTLSCQGDFTQGGFAVCQVPPGAEILVDGEALTTSDAQGYAVVGFDRDAKQAVRITARTAEASSELDLQIAPREWRLQRVDGLPQETVTPTRPEVLRRIQRDSAMKTAALQGRAVQQGFLEAWRWPLEVARVSGPFGAARVLNGVAGRPHYGVDLAAPAGVAVVAPASGVVTLAETGMHFEGGLVFIDHGQGLTSMYLHLSEVTVAPGQLVEAGDLIGNVGATGRATGPHLCWRLKWRDRNLDPSLRAAASQASLQQAP